MTIKLHPNAIISINENAEELLSKISKIETPKNPPQTEKGEYYSVATLTDKDIIGEMEMSLTNGFGEEKGKIFIYKKQRYGLVNSGYEDLIKNVLNIHKIKTLSDNLSFDYIKNCLFRWAKDRYRETSTENFTDYFLDKSKKVILDYEITIPVPYTTISKSFKLGNIEFIILTENIINMWFEKMDTEENTEEKTKEIEQYKRNLKRNLQGFAVGVFKCTAELNRAQEIAYYHISNSLAVLRLFSPANLFTELLNNTYEYGRKMIRTMEFFTKANGDFNHTRSVIDNGLYWKMDNRKIDSFTL